MDNKVRYAANIYIKKASMFCHTRGQGAIAAASAVLLPGPRLCVPLLPCTPCQIATLGRCAAAAPPPVPSVSMSLRT